MRRRQKQAAAANRSLPSAADRAAGDGHVLAKRVPISHREFRPLAPEAEVLRIAAHHAKRIKHVVAPDLRWPLHHRMRMQHAAFAQLHAIADNRIRADAHAGTQFRARRNDRLRMNLRRAHFAASSTLAGISRSTILHISVASAASCPSTVARPSNLQKSPRQETTLISSFN